MNRLLCAFLLWIGVLPAGAATTNLVWRWSNPLPFGANIADLAVRSGESYVAVAEYGQLFTSEDLASWTRRSTGTTRWLRGATYFGTTTNKAARQLLVSAEAGTILASEDLYSFTTINLGTTDWLEGITASPSRAVAVGDNAAIYTSDDGTNWVRRANSFGSIWLRSVTWRTNGVFVAVGESGLIATSPNGITWTRQARTLTTTNLNRVIPLPNGFCAVGEGGVVAIDSSGTGTNWRLVNSGAIGDLYAAALEYRPDLPNSPVGALLVAGDSELRSGVLAINLWIDETDVRRTAPAPKATYLAGFWNTNQAIFAGRAGMILSGVRPTVASSFQWSLPDSPPRSWLFSAATNQSRGTNLSVALSNNVPRISTNPTTNSLIVAVGDGPTILQSDRGVTWSTALLPTNASGVVYLGVASRPGILVAVGSSGILSYSPEAYEPLVSTNRLTNSLGTAFTVVLTNQINTLGLTWYPAKSPVTNTLQGIAASTSGRFIASGAAGVLLSSTNGTNWSKLTSPTTAFLSSVEPFPGGWIATGDAGTILTSADGTTWTKTTSGTQNWIWRARWLNDRFVAVGYKGTILTSTNGSSWTTRTSGLTNNLNDVALIDGYFYAVGNQGVVLGSPDSIQWTRLDTITTKSLQGLARVGGRLITVGADGAILRALVQPLSTPPAIAQWPASPSESLFLFTGETDQFIEYDRGTNLVDWISSDPIEVTDPTGTLLIIDDSTNSSAHQFFRARQVVP